MTDDAPAVRARPSRSAHITATVLLVLGAVALVAGTAQFGSALVGAGGVVGNPVFANARRLPHAQALQQLASGYPVSVMFVLFWLLLGLLLAGAYALMLRALYRRAPTATILAGAFLGGSIIAGLLVGTSVLKVAEFAIQAGAATAAEQEWLRAGVNFMNQLHLFYVSGWLLATGLGWIFLGAAARAAGQATRRPGTLLATAGGGIVLSVAARTLLPVAGPAAPAAVVALGEPLSSVGFGAGLLATGLLLRALPRLRRTRPASDAPPPLRLVERR
jgi:hypothetical protein